MTGTTRRGALAVGAGAIAAAAAAPRVFAAPRDYDLRPVQVADGLWMIEGATEYFSVENGGAIVNCALIETDAGVVVVDTGSSLKYGEALRTAAHGVSGLGVATAINTHHHPDHFFGNQAFADVPLRATGETVAEARLHADAYADNLYRLLDFWMLGTEPAPPAEALAPGRFAVGGREFEALPLAGHTASDLALLDVATGTLIAGDLAFLDRAPTTPHADLEVWRGSLDALAGVEAAAILPGHGPLDRTGRSLTQTRAYLDWLEATLTAAAAQGEAMVEVMAAEMPAEFAAMGAQPQEFHRSVVHLYPAIEAAAMPPAN